MVQQAIREALKHMEAVIDTIPVGRLGQAEEIASAVLWLCSDLAGLAIGSFLIFVFSRQEYINEQVFRCRVVRPHCLRFRAWRYL